MILIAFCICLASANYVFASEDAGKQSSLGDMLSMSLEELVDLEVEIASGVSKPLKTAPAVASVITAKDIQALGLHTLNEVLETVPGLHIAVGGSAWMMSIWSIRGIHTIANPEVKFLINGVPAFRKNSNNHGYAFQMPTSMISRVEVIRGPGSALHGADAFSGVINVITKEPHEIDGVRAGSRAGSFDTYAGWLQYGGEVSGFDIALGFDWQKSHGDPDRIVEKDYLHAIGQAALSIAPGTMDTRREVLDSHLNLHKNGFTLNVHGNLSEKASTPYGFYAISNDGHEVFEKMFLVDTSYTNSTWYPDWDLTGRAYYNYVFGDQYAVFFPSAYRVQLGNPIDTNHSGGFSATGVYEGINKHRFRFGAGVEYHDFEPDQYKNYGPAAAVQFGPLVHVTLHDHIYNSPASRTTYHVLAQDEWSFLPNWELTAGLRYDYFSDFHGTLNPRAALVWEARYDLALKLIYGRAFQAPTFSNMYVKNNPVTIGNPDLKPQTINTYEVALDWQPSSKQHFKVNLFYYKAEDLIDFIGPVPQEATNYGEQEGKGFELELDWEINESIFLHTDFAYQRSVNKITGSPVHDAPVWQLQINPRWAVSSDWLVNGQLYWVGPRHRAANDLRPEINDYQLVNLNVQKKDVLKGLDMSLGIKNLFNEDIREPSPYNSAAPEYSYIPYDYPMEFRSIWAELRYKF